MRTRHSYILLILVALAAGDIMAETNQAIPLPAPALTGTHTLEQLLSQRRSVRDYQDSTIELSEIARLLWAAQGITDARGLRTAPSAGALYPLELYIVAGRVNGLTAGVYHYEPENNQLIKTLHRDVRAAVAKAAYSQEWINDASVIIVFTAVYQRTTKKYGERGVRYVHIEAGHAAQNLFLQAESIGLASIVVGAFSDDAVARIVQLPADVETLLLMPVGHAR
jgi:SagB-type dehydrogenase family enzyme